MKEYSYGVVPYTIKDNRVYLLVSLASKKDLKYGFFKGKIEIGETIKDCAVREFYEETGIKIEKDWLDKYFSQKHIQKDVGVFLLDIDYIINEKVNLNKENYGFKIIEINELYNNIISNQDKILKEIILYFKDLRNIILKNKFKI